MAGGGIGGAMDILVTDLAQFRRKDGADS